MIKKIYYNWNDINKQVTQLAHLISADGWKPDYVVGLTRGGLTPALMLSHFLGCTMHTLDVRLRDTAGGNGPESNLWMAEEAFGYVPDDKRGEYFASEFDVRHHRATKKILIVDDINDTGATLKWIKRDWRSGCLPDHEYWDKVWHRNVRFAVLTNNLASPFAVDYSAEEVNKADEDCWIVYPWEEWWKQ